MVSELPRTFSSCVPEKESFPFFFFAPLKRLMGKQVARMCKQDMFCVLLRFPSVTSDGALMRSR